MQEKNGTNLPIVVLYTYISYPSLHTTSKRRRMDLGTTSEFRGVNLPTQQCQRQANMRFLNLGDTQGQNNVLWTLEQRQSVKTTSIQHCSDVVCRLESPR